MELKMEARRQAANHNASRIGGIDISAETAAVSIR